MLTNPLHELFVVTFLTVARFNGTEAYARVFGCSRASAEVGACRLRKRPEIAREINRRFKAQLAEIDFKPVAREWLERSR